LGVLSQNQMKKKNGNGRRKIPQTQIVEIGIQMGKG
jgi:hypothetical protein